MGRAKEMNMTTQTIERLARGTRVINTTDGEPGTIEGVCTLRRGGRVWSYAVVTSYGREVWDASETLVIEQE